MSGLLSLSMAGTSVMSSVVNTPVNCLFNIVAFLLWSLWVTPSHFSGEIPVLSDCPPPFKEGVKLLSAFCNHVFHIRLISLPTFILLLFSKVFVSLEVACCPWALGFFECFFLERHLIFAVIKSWLCHVNDILDATVVSIILEIADVKLAHMLSTSEVAVWSCIKRLVKYWTVDRLVSLFHKRIFLCGAFIYGALVLACTRITTWSPSPGSGFISPDKARKGEIYPLKTGIYALVGISERTFTR